MNPIQTAIAYGYAGQQVLDFVMKHYPSSKKKIETALQSGYSTEQISNFLSKEFEGKADTKAKRKLASNVLGKPTSAEESRAMELRSKRENKLGKLVGGTALAAAGGVAAGTALRAGMGSANAGSSRLLGGPAAASQGMPLPGARPQGPSMGGGAAQAVGGGQGMQGTMAQIMQAYQKHLARGGKLSLKSFMNTAAKTVMGNAMGAMSGGQQQDQGQQPMQQPGQEPMDVTAEAQWNPIGGTEPPVQPGQPVPGAQAPMQPMPEQMQPQQSNPEIPTIQAPSSNDPADILKSLGILEKIDSLKGKGKSADLISMASHKLLSPEALEIVKQNDINLPAAVWEYMNEGQSQPETSETLPNQGEIEPEMVQNKGKPEPLSAGSTVMLPNGLTGKVTGIEGNKVRITDDEGNKKIAPIDHVISPSPEAIQFSDQQIDSIIEQIPESQRSTAAYAIQRLPGDQLLVMITSNPDDWYLYSNVPGELSEQILSASTKPKTSGKNLFGVYNKEVADSRGSPLTHIFQNPEKYPFEKIKVDFDLLQPFRRASTAKDKREKKAEREAAKKTKGKK